MNSDHRIHLINQSIINSDWLMTDIWEAKIAKCELNFTDVVYRLEKYLNYYIDTKSGIKVFYVFGTAGPGTDNWHYGEVFTDRHVRVLRTEVKFTKDESKTS